MSRATLCVRFPDGEVKAGVYNGTVDIAFPVLHPLTELEAWATWLNEAWPHPWPPEGVETEPVEVATNYGGGFHWKGRATRQLLIEGTEPFEEFSFADGYPEWWPSEPD